MRKHLLLKKVVHKEKEGYWKLMMIVCACIKEGDERKGKEKYLQGVRVK